MSKSGKSDDKPQFFNPESTRLLDRGIHIWVRRPLTEDCKCILCGGITRRPSVNDLCQRYERLTDEERAMYPPFGV